MSKGRMTKGRMTKGRTIKRQKKGRKPSKGRNHIFFQKQVFKPNTWMNSR